MSVVLVTAVMFALGLWLGSRWEREGRVIDEHLARFLRDREGNTNDSRQ